MKKRKKKPEEGGSWMDTYGDMVTLLLCFFVLLYSISNVDNVKWENLVKSLNPEAVEATQQVVPDIAAEEAEPEDGEAARINAQFDTMYDELVKLKEAQGDTADVQVARGDGYQFITFKDKVFFDGDSYVLRPDGGKMLDLFSAAIAPAGAAIKEIQVLGHTSQADPKMQNNIYNDRVMAASRSAVVVSYIQNKGILDSSKLVSVGYGQFRPIAGFDTAEQRAANRRVEILITKTGSAEKSIEEYYQQVYQK